MGDGVGVGLGLSDVAVLSDMNTADSFLGYVISVVDSKVGSSLKGGGRFVGVGWNVGMLLLLRVDTCSVAHVRCRDVMVNGACEGV